MAVPLSVVAADWEIDTARVDLSAQKHTAAITVSNSSDHPASILIETEAWSQLKGRDVYGPSRELIVSPAAFTIAPMGRQIVRVALRRRAEASDELSYRISLHERSLQPLQSSAAEVALRIGLPVFVEPKTGKAAPIMAWKVSRMHGDMLKVGLQNQGNAHVLIFDFSLYAPAGGQSIAGEAASSYVLAGQSREWLLKTNAAEVVRHGRVRLKAYTDAGNSEMELALDNP